VVVGQVFQVQADGTSLCLPACWIENGSVLNVLDYLPGGASASSVNESGEIVGFGTYSAGNARGLYWASRTTTPVVLEPLAGDVESIAVGINDDGVICGYSLDAVYCFRAVAWRIAGGVPTSPIELPGPDALSAYATAVNENDGDGCAVVVGAFCDAESPTAAVVWTVISRSDGTLAVDSGPWLLTGVRAQADGVNNSAAICGTDRTVNGLGEAVVWAGDSKKTLPRAKWFYAAHAYDINDHGVIVGYGDYHKMYTSGPQAVVWPSATGSMVRLNDLVYSGSPITGMYSANAVNNDGWIVGRGWDGSRTAAFLAIPK
jgi:uncharacterized membrane protein